MFSMLMLEQDSPQQRCTVRQTTKIVEIRFPSFPPQGDIMVQVPDEEPRHRTKGELVWQRLGVRSFGFAPDFCVIDDKIFTAVHGIAVVLVKSALLRE